MTDGIRLRVISLGAGVQSTTMALMAARGELGPMPDCAIFADTGAEPQAVYDHLRWLMSDGVLPFKVHVVNGGNLFNIIGSPQKSRKWPHQPLPAFAKGADGRGALLRRSCTRDYKIRPVHRKIRELTGLTRKKSPKTPIVEEWIGISTDEVQRAKPAREAYIVKRFPLIERKMSRSDCLQWMAKNGYPRPPKSSCTFCPFHDEAQWAATQRDPAAWAQAVEIDERIRDLGHGRTEQNFLHRSLKPLRELTFDPKAEADEFDEKSFAVECEGMCGV